MIIPSYVEQGLIAIDIAVAIYVIAKVSKKKK